MRRRHSKRFSLLTILFLLAVCGRISPTCAREPTGLEQYLLELLNRARADPIAEVQRLADRIWGDKGLPAIADLNEGISVGTISAGPKQPLAFNLQLIDAASDYADALLASHKFTHSLGGTNPGSRAVAAGYVFDPPWTWGENLAINASSVPFPDPQHEAARQHEGLFIDGDVDERGHRKNMMKGAFQEIGIGLGTSRTSRYFQCCSHAVLSTFTFAASSNSPQKPGATDSPFLTGVAYHDLDDDGFYSPQGEGIASLTIDAFPSGSSTPAATATTFASGGYTLEGLVAGVYDVRFYGDGVDQTYYDVEIDGLNNTKLDAMDPGFVQLAADFTGDGTVDAADLAAWQVHFGVSGGPVVVDGSDLLEWQRQLDGSAVQLPTSASIPEPSSAILITVLTATALGFHTLRRN